ncbi:hypothetical protein AVEN_150052-1 [Araneus ventricosus]|uniref:Uncharacterized protein n=1 Tax=Araneus ventricosus TaxID=182803 RepID=A0A4Y2GUY8_ARAVE|nr:hypothetical protein AVEN_150052-1 [Araneus ventricosus]
MPLASVHETRVIMNEIKDNIRENFGDTQLIWLRDHRGFEGNERADQLAKMASTKDRVNFSFCPPRIQIKNAARREIWRHGNNVGQAFLTLDGSTHC